MGRYRLNHKALHLPPWRYTMSGYLRSLLNRRNLALSRQRRQARLRVEELESRTVLSVLTPAQVQHAYGFDQATFSANGQSILGDGTGQTIAIVDAYDNPNI